MTNRKRPGLRILLSTALCFAAALPAVALPKMDITSAKGTLYKRNLI